MSRSPQLRLLDMLLGWADTVNENFTEESDEINKLYQEIGTKENMSDIEVKYFLLDKVYPVLRKGKNIP